MKKLFGILLVASVVLLSGCSKDTIEESIPSSTSNEEVQEYVDNNYPKYSKDISDYLDDRDDSNASTVTDPSMDEEMAVDNSGLSIEDEIKSSLSDNLVSVLTLNDEVGCWINIYPLYREVLVDLRCNNSELNDDTKDINDSMRITGIVLNTLSYRLDELNNYSNETLTDYGANKIQLTVDYYDENSVLRQYLTVKLFTKDGNIYLDPSSSNAIILLETDGSLVNGSLSYSYNYNKDKAINCSENFPFINGGTCIDSNGDSYELLVYDK